MLRGLAFENKLWTRAKPSPAQAWLQSQRPSEWAEPGGLVLGSLDGSLSLGFRDGVWDAGFGVYGFGLTV